MTITIRSELILIVNMISDILSDDTINMVLCRTLQVYVGHSTLKITSEHLTLAGHIV